MLHLTGDYALASRTVVSQAANFRPIRQFFFTVIALLCTAALFDDAGSAWWCYRLSLDMSSRSALEIATQES